MQKQHQRESGIRLREVSKGDVSFLTRVANDPSLMEILCDEPSNARYWERVVSIWQADPDEEAFIITRESDDTDMGWLGINGLVSTEDTVWLKMMVLLPEFWGQRYGSYALQEVKKHLAASGSARICLWTDQCNERSQTCYRKNGFVAIDSKIASVGTRKILRERILMACRIPASIDGR